MRVIIAALTLFIAAGLSACHKPGEYQPATITNPSGFDPATILAITPAPTSIPADGLSRSTIEAKIAAEATARHVTFQTSLGTLSSGGSNMSVGQSVTIQADATGTARVELVSAVTVAIAQVTVSVGPADSTKPRIMVRTIDVPFTPVPAGTSFITVTPASATAPADGVTTTRIVARVSSTLLPTQRSVTFTTTNGEFTFGTTAGNKQVATVTADSSNVAVIDLRSPVSISTADITATVFNNSAFTAVAFQRAFPDTMFIVSSAPSVTAAGGQTATITVQLFRDVGQVTNNATVTYEARDAGGNVIGTWTGVTLGTHDPQDDDKKTLLSQATFNPADTAVLGTATITVRCGPAVGTIQILLN